MTCVFIKHIHVWPIASKSSLLVPVFSPVAQVEAWLLKRVRQAGGVARGQTGNPSKTGRVATTTSSCTAYRVKRPHVGAVRLSLCKLKNTCDHMGMRRRRLASKSALVARLTQMDVEGTGTMENRRRDMLADTLPNTSAQNLTLLRSMCAGGHGFCRNSGPAKFRFQAFCITLPKPLGVGHFSRWRCLASGWAFSGLDQGAAHTFLCILDRDKVTSNKIDKQ